LKAAYQSGFFCSQYSRSKGTREESGLFFGTEKEGEKEIGVREAEAFGTEAPGYNGKRERAEKYRAG
jgi:hypothetical protein